MTSPHTLAVPQGSTRSIESVLLSGWGRLLVPSLSDLFFVAIFVWVFMSAGAAGWDGLLTDADVGWHIRTGEYILDHHAVPHHDLYSFSKPDAPWYAWEWLTDVLDAELHRMAGLKGIVLFYGVLIAIFATTLIRRMVWRNVHLFCAIVVALLGIGCSTIHFLARPHVFTLLFMSISVWMIEADRRARTQASARRLWLLIPLTIVWTNVHGGFLALIAVLGLTAAGMAIEAFLGSRDFGKALRYLTLTGCCALASLVNPYGYQLHVHMGKYLRSDWIRSVIQEFQSPSFRTESMMQFEILMLVGILGAAAFFRRRRIVEGLWILFFAHMALGSVRHVPVYIAVVSPVIAGQLSSWWRGATRDASKKSLLGIVNLMAADSLPNFRRTSIWPAALVAALVLIGHPIKWPKDFPVEMFPTAMIHEHAAEILNARVLTTDQWADYLIYLNPKQKVFIDGRSDFYGPEVGNQYIRLTNGGSDWRTILEKYNFDLVLLPVDQPLVQLLKLLPDWKIEAENGKQILLVRRPTQVPVARYSPQERRSYGRAHSSVARLMKSTDLAEVLLETSLIGEREPCRNGTGL